LKENSVARNFKRRQKSGERRGTKVLLCTLRTISAKNERKVFTGDVLKRDITERRGVAQERKELSTNSEGSRKKQQEQGGKNLKRKLLKTFLRGVGKQSAKKPGGVRTKLKKKRKNLAATDKKGQN